MPTVRFISDTSPAPIYRLISLPDTIALKEMMS